jgi:predicted deacylase
MTMWQRVRVLAVILAVGVVGAAQVGEAQTPFAIGDKSVAPGTKVSGELKVPAGAGDEGTIIPYSVVHGAKPGPVLALVAGTHGHEYPPILALQRIGATIDPQTLSGTVLIVHVANMPSYLKRTIYYTPTDGKNLNRVFPGKKDGTLSDRIAWVLTSEIIDRATHLVDIHCGDGNEWLRPYVYWETTGTPAVTAIGRDMVLAFGMEHIIIDTSRPTDPKTSTYLSNTAITRGKPAFTAESGGWARTSEEDVVRVERGVAGLMRYLKMRSGGPEPLAYPVWLGRNQVLTSGFTGMFYPAVEPGVSVAQGSLIGRVTDFFGKTLEEIRSPFAGEVLYVVATPPISKGEPVGFVAERVTSPEAYLKK